MAVTQRRTALTAAVATAIALGATVLTVPAHAAGEDPGAAAKKPPTKFQLKDGTLTWGIKESFRKYLVGPIGGGKIQLADGAKQAPKNGPFTFTGGKGTYDLKKHAVTTTFKGSVRFLGHAKGKGWELDLKFSDLKLITEGQKGRITADVTTAGKTRNDVAVASLNLAKVKPAGGKGGVLKFADIPATLTADGSKVFSYQGRPFYQPGTPLDAATLSVKQGAPVPDSKPKPKPKPKPKGVAAGELKDSDVQDESFVPKAGHPKPGHHENSGKSEAAGDAAKKAETLTAAASGQVFDGRLDWGFKESFRKYLTGPIAAGKIEVADGAEKRDNGFRFTKGSGQYDAGKSSLNATFNGSVHFLGHPKGKGWELDVKLSKFRVKADGAKGQLWAQAETKDQGGKTQFNQEIPLVDLKLYSDSLKAKDGVISLKDVQTTATADLGKVFRYQGRPSYQVGDGLDPLTAKIAVNKDAKLDDDSTSTNTDGTGSTGSTGTGTGTGSSGTGTSGTGTEGAKGGVTGTDDTLAHTGSDAPTGPLAGSAAALVLAGGAAVWTARRKSANAGA
ncbi:HtaA domain-containing protein [Streptomyces sp. I05A-00742]|uniref:HtaA domain-containing protein n=1 Tax=Streptomyces sp. I05A-00742 TaxID=2732853 RepID=UPI001489DEE6|nr:HtaA domain-containing protein [Streptomyces sp. I05A-00742]